MLNANFLIPLKAWIYNSIYYPLKCSYDRRWTQYTHTGKIALCCIVKMENGYIRFFVEYYKNLGFDKLFLYDNNDIDGEQLDEVIGDYIHDGFVDVIDFRGRPVAQLSAYQDCYDKYNKQYDWIAFFDCDEFLTFANAATDVHRYLRQWKFLPYQVLHVNWMVYGDNEMLDNDGRNVIERLSCPIQPFHFCSQYSDIPENNHVKSIVRGGLSLIDWIETPHTPVSKILRCCNSEGEQVDINLPFQNYNFQTLYIRHYCTKTIGEWVKNKMKRGIPDRSVMAWHDVLNLDRFFEYNKKTKEKLDYAIKVMDDL